MREYFLNLERMQDAEAIQDYFVEMLELPGWYGRNFDALYDVLTDIMEETVFVLWPEKEEPSDCMKQMIRVLTDAAKENSRITIISKK